MKPDKQFKDSMQPTQQITNGNLVPAALPRESVSDSPFTLVLFNDVTGKIPARVGIPAKTKQAIDDYCKKYDLFIRCHHSVGLWMRSRRNTGRRGGNGSGARG